MLRKNISKLMALVVTLTSAVSAVPAAEAKEGFVADGYEIIDAAYGNGTYVVMAKNQAVKDSNNNYKQQAKIYTSTDKKHWTETQSAANAYRWGSPNSKQNLLYWQEQNVFVASVGNTVYTSSNGISWDENADLKTGYAMIDEKDGTLVLINSNSGSTRTVLSLTEIGTATADIKKFYPFVMAAGDTTDSGTGYFMAGKWQNYRRMKNLEQGITSFTFGDGDAVDAKYVKSMDGWIVLTASKTITNIANTETAGFKRFSVTINGEAPEYNFSALGVNNDTVFVGDTNGGIYTMAAPESATSETQTLIEVAPTAGTDAITEKVTDFVSIDENTFFVTTATGVYTLNKNGDAWTYSDCLKYTDIEDAKVSGSFNGIKLLAGVYSPDLGIYATIGNDQNSRSHIFYSENGINWTMTGATTFGASTSAKNLAVWWPAQKCFVISNAVSQGTGAAWVSTDGKSWSHRLMQLGDNGDLQILGDYLYSANYSSMRTLKRYSNLTDTPTKIFYSPNNIAYNMNTIALSDDETPYVFAGGISGGMYVVSPTSENDDVGKTEKSLIDNQGPNSKMIDAHWNKTINKFVAVNPVQKNIYMFSKDKTWESLPVNAEAGTLVAVETNGSSYLTGDVNGNLFFTNGTDLSTAKAKKFSKVDCLGATANTMPVTNIFAGADGKYIVTVSDGTTSDVLIVNSDGSGYVKASEESRITSIKGGDEFTVSVKVANYGETAQTVRLIAAIYDKSGTKLLQMVSDDKTMALNSTQYLELPVTANEDIPADATLKVFIWNSLGAMVPLTNGDNFF